jgi:hypothetical protein
VIINPINIQVENGYGDWHNITEYKKNLSILYERLTKNFLNITNMCAKIFSQNQTQHRLA